MDSTIQLLIYLHAIFGGIGLLSGLFSLLVRKGGYNHKKTGRIFSYSMLISSLFSLIVARMPGHENLFLFLIGIFTIYLVLAGNRALTLKNRTKTKADALDKLVSGSMLFTSIGMLVIGLLGVLQKIDQSLLYLFFGSFGAFMSLKDFHNFKVFRQKKNVWLKSHLGRMVGALIASVTAFLVAGLHIGTTLIWISPTLIGTAYIIYWNNKFRLTKKNKAI